MAIVQRAAQRGQDHDRQRLATVGDPVFEGSVEVAVGTVTKRINHRSPGMGEGQLGISLPIDLFGSEVSTSTGCYFSPGVLTLPRLAGRIERLPGPARATPAA